MSTADEDQKGSRSKDPGMAFPGRNGFIGEQIAKPPNVLGTGHSARDLVTIVLAEFLGTGMLMLLGCMCCVAGFGHTPTNVSAGIGFGFVVMMVINTFGVVSGAHINPSVTIAAFVYKMVTFPMLILYIIAQFAGAICGYGLLMAVSPYQYFTAALDEGNGSCVTAPHEDLGTWEAFGVEFLITSTLIWNCCGLWDPRNAKNTDSTSVKFALIVAGLSIAAGPYTGASMNSARTFAPAVWNGSYKQLWIYFVAPPLAGLIMPLIYKYVFRRELPPVEEDRQPIVYPAEEMKVQTVEQHRF